VGQDELRGSGVIDEDEKVNLKDIKNFSGMFWILVLNCALIYGSFFAFNANANALLFSMYGIPTNIAGVYLLSIYLSASIITPFFGMIIDKYGKRVVLMMFSVGLFMLAIVVFCLLPSQVN
jgi:nitrate/nitrite transporter NarK